LKPDGVLVLEIGHDQGDAVSALLENAGYQNVSILKDYGGHDRIAKGNLSGSI
jgi:release factor glutamine methyltransferase